MNIGLVSYEFKNSDISYNLKQVEKAFRAVKGKVDLLCFGESFLQGFDALSWNYDIDKKIALSLDSGIIKSLCAMTVDYNTDLAIGYFELFENAIYSSYLLIENGEIVYNYRRISDSWKEKRCDNNFYKEGNITENIIYKDHTLKIGLCGDLWVYPERFKTDGILLWPVYVNFSLEQWQNEQLEYGNHLKDICDCCVMINSISKQPDSVGGAFVYHKGQLVLDVIYEIENIVIIGV